MKKNNLITLLVLLFISLLYASPILQNINFWGQMDWDQFTFWNAIPRDTLLRYHQFPLWNPYANGGNVLLAHPHSSFLSPFYVFVLFFGPVVGLKCEIIVHLFVGLFGMFTLSRYLKLEQRPAYCASFVYMLSSVYVLHIMEGHASWMPMAFMPWTLLYYSKSLINIKCIWGTIFFLGLTLFGGSVDVFNILVVFLVTYSLLKALQSKGMSPLKVLILTFVGTFLLCAIKLFPMLEFLNYYPRITYDFSGTEWATLYKTFLDRNQLLLYLGQWDTKGGAVHGWHEFGAYVGVVPLLLFVCGVIVKFKKYWPLIITGFICLAISLGSALPVNLWGILHMLPVYKSLTVPSRFILGFVFTVAILSGFGISAIETFIFVKFRDKKINWSKVLSCLIISFVFFDLFLTNSIVFKNTFRIPPKEIKQFDDFRQRFHYINYFEKDKFTNVKNEENSRTSQYPVFLSNSGILEANEVIQVERGAVKVVNDFDYRGESYLLKSNGKIYKHKFFPNKIEMDIDVKISDVLVVNQNFYPGWKVKKDGKVFSAESYKGLISTPVLPGHREIIFYYMPLSFLIGIFVTVSCVLFAGVCYVRRSRID